MKTNGEQKAGLSQNRHLESWLYPVNVALAKVIPLSLAYYISLPIADLFYWLWASKRQGALRNYARMLGCSTDDEKVQRLARNSFRNFGKYVVELLHVQGWSTGQFQRVTIQGDEHFDEALRHGKGVIFTSAHMGSIEVGSALVLLRGFHITSVMEQLRPKVMMDWIVTCRAKMGVSLLPTAGTGRQLLRALRRGEMVALIVDVGYKDNGGVPVTFLGHHTYFPAGPARLARISGAPIVFGVAVRQPGNRFIAYGSPPIFSDRTKDAEQDIRDVTQEMVNIFESFVRRYPDQWYVFRDMWPEEE
ncbi:MAG: lysophospholipid acyltransferase family protein [Dehalococcoidia bacterium]|nr:lysophospholipid acyltransferase family protein [Dehalococcoidia bacterium]